MKTLQERFWPKVDKSGECWNWTGVLGGGGYGYISVGGRTGRDLRAHRVSYEWAHGPIPDGLEIDHLCQNKRCVNPDHLEAVTKSENQLRWREGRATCNHGHPLSAETYRAVPSENHRRCIVCRNQAHNLYRRERRAAMRGAA